MGPQPTGFTFKEVVRLRHRGTCVSSRRLKRARSAMWWASADGLEADPRRRGRPRPREVLSGMVGSDGLV
eukprot:9037560-Pyramimonas_sp.AAC.1